MNEQEIAGAVGSAALQLQQRRRGGPGLWLSLERRGRAHLLLCADLVRCYREELDALEEEEEEDSDAGGGGGSSTREAASYAGVGGKRKSNHPEARDGGGGGGRKRPRAVDPWEDMMGALSPFDGRGRLSSIPGGGRSGR